MPQLQASNNTPYLGLSIGCAESSFAACTSRYFVLFLPTPLFAPFSFCPSLFDSFTLCTVCSCVPFCTRESRFSPIRQQEDGFFPPTPTDMIPVGDRAVRGRCQVGRFGRACDWGKWSDRRDGTTSTRTNRHSRISDDCLHQSVSRDLGSVTQTGSAPSLRRVGQTASVHAGQQTMASRWRVLSGHRVTVQGGARDAKRGTNEAPRGSLPHVPRGVVRTWARERRRA